MKSTILTFFLLLAASSIATGQCLVAYDPLQNQLTCTPAITKVSGVTMPSSVTSGGIPYYSSTSAQASSAVWTANTLMKGGGAGVAPVVTGISVDASNNVTGAATEAIGTTPAASGTVRLPNTGSVVARNAANNGDLGLIDTTAANILRLGFNNIVSLSIGATSMSTGSNCSSSASPAVCGAANTGSVVVAAAATTVVVNTTAVTANSQIFLTYDASLGTKLSVTCNVTEPALYGVTARTAATSFTITASSPTTNPACFSYFILN